MPGTSLWRNSAWRELCSGSTPSSTGTGKPPGPKIPRARSSIASTWAGAYRGWVMIKSAPAASLRSRRAHSLSASAAVGSRAQAIVKPARWPIAEPAWSSPWLRRRMISISPTASTSQIARVVSRSAARGGSPVRARMFRMPRACAPSSSASRAIRLRSRVVRWTRHSRPTSCWMPKATARAPIRTRPVAESLTFTRSTPASRKEAGGVEGAVDPDRARRVYLDRDDEGALGELAGEAGRRRRLTLRPGLAPRRPGRAAASVSSRSEASRSEASGRGATAACGPRRRPAPWRRWPPASPPCGPASCRSSRPRSWLRRRSSAAPSRRSTRARPSRRGDPSMRCGRPALGWSERATMPVGRAGSQQRLEAGLRTRAAVDPDRVHARRGQRRGGQRRAWCRRPAAGPRRTSAGR